jgi:hypothetical protein
VFFAGFPHGLSIDGRALNSGFPLPLVKHGIIAAIGSGAGGPFIIDAIGNSGFSGGPVVFGGGDPSRPTIAGIVKGWVQVEEPVFKLGHEDPDLSVWNSNPGLLLAFDINYAVTAIRKSPSGYQVRSSA